ncbi:GntR family transcriptional regulator [Microbispora sp. SCL1-1]|uniref:GntR family transcriptional regulator n=1 Tax=unclassified Microbispora TaxID=2614687 RepID=UPI001157B782|nr:MULTISPECIES: GntR family transcriptional regulator [unclassified Microbispora]NJP24501.1 GntR family transcriptional regulator [Microbispora sp. CL1-1]TQS14645.1 GntR family transcriptional regulator [Microbispora sp. SCL1-1]
MEDVPAHLLIAAELRAQIMAGNLEPGAQLPSTAQLMDQFGAATSTVQAALRALKKEGFLDSHRGKGVFVKASPLAVVDVAAYYDPASRGVTYKLLDVAEVRPPADVARALGEDLAVLRYRRTDRDGTPVELSWSYYPLSLVAGTALTGRTKIRGGAPAVLAELGYPEREFTDRISTRAATAEEIERLNIPPGVPVLRQFRVIYSDDARPVEVSVIVKAGNRFELTYRQVIPTEEA